MTTKEKESVSQLGRAAARDLRALLQSEVSLPGEPAYERARQIVNGAVNLSPSLFVFCERSKDVQEAVRIARSYRLPLSVRGGGHDWAGRALRDQGLVIDLSRMRRVAVDVEANEDSVFPYDRAGVREARNWRLPLDAVPFAASQGIGRFASP